MNILGKPKEDFFKCHPGLHRNHLWLLRRVTFHPRAALEGKVSPSCLMYDSSAVARMDRD